MVLAAVTVALTPLLVGLLIGALFGVFAYLICARLLHADQAVSSLVGVVVFVLLFLAISGLH